MDAGLLPVKPLAQAKRRLTPSFNARWRTEIARALLRDALDLCASTRGLRWWVVTDDPEVAVAAREAGVEVLPDGQGSLNGALLTALQAVARMGAGSATVLPADVPLTRPEDVEDIVDTGATSDVVVVPARRGGGTNALHLSPPDVMEPRFGPGSLRAHLETAERRSLRCSVLPLSRLAVDLDTPEDVDELLRLESSHSHTVRALRRLGRQPAAPAAK